MTEHLTDSEKLQKNNDIVQQLIRDLMQFYVTLKKNKIQQGILHKIINDIIHSKNITLVEIVSLISNRITFLIKKKTKENGTTKYNDELSTLMGAIKIILDPVNSIEKVSDPDHHGQIERNPATRIQSNVSDEEE